jgi:fructokinase
VLDPAGAFLMRERLPTPQDDYPATLDAIAALVDRTGALAPADTPVGIGIPGTVSPATGRVKNANSTWLNGRPLAQDLAHRLGRRVRLQNDANCLAVSEATDGAGAGAKTVFAVILGTGVGAGIAIDGRVLVGANAIAGEWGHNPLPRPHAGESPGPRCWCGRDGCLETWLSGPAFERDFAAGGGAPGLRAPAIAALAARGEPVAGAALDRLCDRLARALASVLNILDPDVVVLGGGLSNLAPLYDEIPARWGAHVFSDRVDTRLAPARHGDSSGVRGAAWLFRP